MADTTIRARLEAALNAYAAVLEDTRASQKDRDFARCGIAQALSIDEWVDVAARLPDEPPHSTISG